jgi:hypothetical protein
VNDWSGHQQMSHTTDGCYGSRGKKGLHLWWAPSWEEIANVETTENAGSKSPQP